MSEDVPLSAFGSDDDSDGEGKSSEGDESAVEPADEPAESDPAEPPSVTYTSSPDGEPCAACGETVEKRWRAGEGGVSGDREGVDDPDALVCPDCKQW
ncbi:MAG: hypothetical protein V5A38_02900 [Halolamina sp.]|uniref:DUF7573 domain-containing protein n=1 Tax=Halolamina sp. TaxID=1940283 RepID=UPI002FC3724F